MTYAELKKEITEKLTATCGEFSDFEGACILEALCGLSRKDYYLRSRETAIFDEKKLASVISRRIDKEPLAYILGETVFFGHRIFVSPDCLIPRADTEFVCEKALSFLPPNGNAADLCTGSGCIAVTLASEGKARVTAVDISEKALQLAKKNALCNQVSDLVSFQCADVRTDCLQENSVFDVIVSNPPYIRSAVVPTLDPEVQKEPALALDGGEDGLLFYRAMLSYLPKHLSSNGKIVFEIGFDQENDMAMLAKQFGLSCTVHRDYGGNPRVAVFSQYAS